LYFAHNGVVVARDSSAEEASSSNQENNHDNNAAEVDDVSMGIAEVPDAGLGEDWVSASDSQADSGSVNSEQNSEGIESDQNVLPHDESFETDSNLGSDNGVYED